MRTAEPPPPPFSFSCHVANVVLTNAKQTLISRLCVQDISAKVRVAMEWLKWPRKFTSQQRGLPNVHILDIHAVDGTAAAVDTGNSGHKAVHYTVPSKNQGNCRECFRDVGEMLTSPSFADKLAIMLILVPTVFCLSSKRKIKINDQMTKITKLRHRGRGCGGGRRGLSRRTSEWIAARASEM